MGKFTLFFVVLLALIVSPIQSINRRGGVKKPASQKLRIVTWNVADNSKMADGFTPDALDKVLGLTKRGKKNLPDIYVIGLQEQCWKCNVGNTGQILKKFEERLKPHGKYVAVGFEGTRQTRTCEAQCAALGNHGTTAVVVLALRGVVTGTTFNHINAGCSSSTPGNDEKGLAYAQLKLSSKRSICVASAHLDSRLPNVRRECLKNFFQAADKTVKWSSCSSKFIFGDFNTRTGEDKKKSNEGIDSISQTMIKSLKLNDELIGSKPYGTDKSWSKNLMQYINSCQRETYKELPLNFAPTYKQGDAKKMCKGKTPCYRADRPLSWTDRIVYTSAVGDSYNSIDVQSSDHWPVMADFAV